MKIPPIGGGLWRDPEAPKFLSSLHKFSSCPFKYFENSSDYSNFSKKIFKIPFALWVSQRGSPYKSSNGLLADVMNLNVKWYSIAPIGVARMLIRGENILVWPCGGSGAEPPGAGEFSKIFKRIIKNKTQFFARLDEKCILLGNFEKILKIFGENSIEKLHF